jgi:hypothetical protein
MKYERQVDKTACSNTTPDDLNGKSVQGIDR